MTETRIIEIAIETFFNDFFFGEGITSWIALFGIAGVLMAFTSKYKYFAFVSVLVCIGLSTEYISRISSSGNFAWHLIVVFLIAIGSVWRAGLD